MEVVAELTLQVKTLSPERLRDLPNIISGQSPDIGSGFHADSRISS